MHLTNGLGNVWIGPSFSKHLSGGKVFKLKKKKDDCCIYRAPNIYVKSENAVNHPNVSKFLEAWYTGLKIKTHTHTHICFEDLLYSTGNSAQCYVGAWMGGSLGENGCTYVYGWVPLLSTCNNRNVVNQLYSNIK